MIASGHESHSIFSRIFRGFPRTTKEFFVARVGVLVNPLLFLAPEKIIARKFVDATIAVVSHIHGKRLEDELKAGRLPIIPNSPILLGRAETCHFLQPSVAVLESKTVTVARGSAGVSVRYKIAPGFSVGGRVSASAPVKAEQLVTISQGTFVVTNKRLVITGFNGTLEVPFSKLIDCRDGGDCLVVALKGKTSHLYLTGKGIKFGLLARIVQVAFRNT
jgi:hypothetical protein